MCSGLQKMFLNDGSAGSDYTEELPLLFSPTRCLQLGAAILRPGFAVPIGPGREWSTAERRRLTQSFDPAEKSCPTGIFLILLGPGQAKTERTPQKVPRGRPSL